VNTSNKRIAAGPVTYIAAALCGIGGVTIGVTHGPFWIVVLLIVALLGSAAFWEYSKTKRR